MAGIIEMKRRFKGWIDEGLVHDSLDLRKLLSEHGFDEDCIAKSVSLFEDMQASGLLPPPPEPEESELLKACKKCVRLVVNTGVNNAADLQTVLSELGHKLDFWKDPDTQELCLVIFEEMKAAGEIKNETIFKYTAEDFASLDSIKKVLRNCVAMGITTPFVLHTYLTRVTGEVGVTLSDDRLLLCLQLFRKMLPDNKFVYPVAPTTAKAPSEGFFSNWSLLDWIVLPISALVTILNFMFSVGGAIGKEKAK